MRTQLLSHNKTAYQKVIQAFRTSNRTCVVHPTGTGKSYLIAAVSENFKNVLILGPNYFVLEQVRGVLKWRKEGVEYMTYQGLNLNGALGTYDLICLDEFHRAGADVWGDAVTELMEMQPNAKVFGTTATPIRHLDGERNMAEEIFSGNVASEITVGEAMSRNILPIPTYVTGLFDFGNTIRAAAEKIITSKYISQEEKQKRMEKLNVSDEEWEQCSGMPVILRKHISKECRRIIVFCSDVPTLKQMSQTVENWFTKAGLNVKGIYYIHNEMSDAKQKKVMGDFETDDGDGCKVMMSVNMLNEGIHIPRVGAVLMLRTTVSRIIYMQQMGRCLTAANNERPVILDMVDNITNTSAAHDLKREFDAAEIVKAEREPGEYIPRQLHITDYTHTVRDVINALQQGTTNNRMTLDDLKQKIRDFADEHDRWPSHMQNTSKYERGLAHRFYNRKDELTKDESFRQLYEYYRIKDLPKFDEYYKIVTDYCREYNQAPIIPSRAELRKEITDELRKAVSCWNWLKKNYGDDERVKYIRDNYNNRRLRETEITRRIEILTAFANEKHRQPNSFHEGEEKLNGYYNTFKDSYACRDDVKKLLDLFESFKPKKDTAEKVLAEYIQFCKKHKRLPSRFSKDPDEVDLYKRVKGRKKLPENEKYKQVTEQYKKQRMDRQEELSIVIEHCEKSHRLPSKCSCGKEVYRAWQNIKRTDPDMADKIRNKYPRRRLWTDDDIEQYALQITAFIREHGRRPNALKGEQRLVNILDMLLRNRPEHPAVVELRKQIERLPPKVFTSFFSKRQRNLRNNGKRKFGYKTCQDRGANPSTRYTVFYTAATRRSERYEKACREAGLQIKALEND